MFDWNDTRYFLAIARLGSLSKAARHLRVQQSTVGRRLAALEQSLDTRLFERTSDGYVATPAGEALVPHAERIEDEALAVERELAGHEEVVAGTVRMTAPQAFGFYFVVPLLARLHADQPDILCELVADNFALNLSRREADLALRLGRPVQQQLLLRKLGSVTDALYVARCYLERFGPVHGDDLGKHLFIGFDETYGRTADGLWFMQRMRGARCVLKINGTPGMMTAVRAGMGIGLLPCWLADPDGELVRVLPEQVHAHDLWLVIHRDLRHAARIRMVSEFFVREFARAAPLLSGRRGKRSPARSR